jgi:hypothetical protein
MFEKTPVKRLLRCHLCDRTVTQTGMRDAKGFDDWDPLPAGWMVVDALRGVYRCYRKHSAGGSK